jgi:hypothetical protein
LVGDRFLAWSIMAATREQGPTKGREERRDVL